MDIFQENEMAYKSKNNLSSKYVKTLLKYVFNSSNLEGKNSLAKDTDFIKFEILAKFKVENLKVQLIEITDHKHDRFF